MIEERGKPPFRNPTKPPKKVLQMEDKGKPPFRNPVNPPPKPK